MKSRGKMIRFIHDENSFLLNEIDAPECYCFVFGKREIYFIENHYLVYRECKYYYDT